MESTPNTNNDITDEILDEVNDFMIRTIISTF